MVSHDNISSLFISFLMVFSKSTILVRPVYYSILDREVNIFHFLVTIYLDKGNEKCNFFSSLMKD